MKPKFLYNADGIFQCAGSPNERVVTMAAKECFGQLANMRITCNNSTQKHFLRVDEDKLKECDKCSLFNKCMFLRYNELMQEMLRMLDDTGAVDTRPRIG